MQKMKNTKIDFITGEELTAKEIHSLLNLALQLKMERKAGQAHPILAGKILALLFDKPSLRTRFSFSVAMKELGGDIVDSISDSRKDEGPEVTGKVLSGYCDGIMIRTFVDSYIRDMAASASVPVVNGLSDDHHPCQTLADLLTLKECFGELEGKTIAYIGDGNNILHSLLLLAPICGVNIRYACPGGYNPKEEVLAQALERCTQAKEEGNKVGYIESCVAPELAVQGANAVYTDTWVSMGFEVEKAKREKAFANYQVNEALMEKAEKDAVFMHCLPMERGKEVSASLPESKCSVIYSQSENRLHAQKALLVSLMGV